jgi:hypothetical protein
MKIKELKIGDIIKVNLHGTITIGIIKNISDDYNNILCWYQNNINYDFTVNLSAVICKMEPVYKEIPIDLPPPPMKKFEIVMKPQYINIKNNQTPYSTYSNWYGCADENGRTLMKGIDSRGDDINVDIPMKLNVNVNKHYKITIEEL